MKNFPKIIIVIFTGILFSCEKTTLDEPVEAIILQHTCGGTVITFTSENFGEDWVDVFDESQSYNNVVVTTDLDSQDFEEGDVIIFSFKETNQLKGRICDISGLPETRVELQDIKLKI